MAHLKKFENQAAYDSGKYDLEAPAVSLISGVGVVYDKTLPPTFGGLRIASGPLKYQYGYQILEKWDADSSFGSKFSVTNGSTYFNFLEMGQLFEKANFSASDGDIENLLNPLDGWRLPTLAEWCTLTTGASPGTSRAGSKVNGSQGAKYARIQLTGVTYSSVTNPDGLLLFPDKRTITGKALSGVNNMTKTTGVTTVELDAYLEQGCVFLPDMGEYTRDSRYWYTGKDSGGSYWSATAGNNDGQGLSFNISNYGIYLPAPSAKDYMYYPIRLVKSA